MYSDVYTFYGKEPGPTSIILAGVHGNEICGVNAFKRIIPSLTVEAGTVFFMYGNPKAILQNVRYVESNLNRLFLEKSQLTENEIGSYEYKQSEKIKTYLNQSTALLDVHASSIKNSKPFIICENNAFHIAQYLPASLVVSGFDRIQPGGTDYYMNQRNKIGICLECGFTEDEVSIEVAEDGILAFLTARGHITSEKTFSQTQSFIRMYERYLTQTNDFRLAEKFTDFTKVEAGTLIGCDGGEAIRASKPGVILFAHNRNKVGDEAFLLGEYTI